MINSYKIKVAKGESKQFVLRDKDGRLMGHVYVEDGQTRFSGLMTLEPGKDFPPGENKEF